MKHGGREITEDKPNRQATAVMVQQPTTAPPPLPLKPAAFPPFREAVLPNGLRLVVVENHRLGMPVIQYRNGQMAEVPAEELLPLALRFLETNGEPTPAQIGTAA